MAVDAAFVIRAGSSVLFIVLAVAIAVVGRRSRGAWALAALVGAHGFTALVNNIWLATVRDDPAKAFFATWTAVAQGVSALAVVMLLPRPLARREWPALAAGVLLGVLVWTLLYLGGDGPSAATQAMPGGVAFGRAGSLAFTIGWATLLVTSSIRIAQDAPKERAAWVRWTALVILLGPYFVNLVPRLANYSTEAWAFVALLLVVAAPTVAWLVAAARSGHRGAVLVALVWPAIGLATLAYLLVPANAALENRDAFGLNGALRMVGWSFLVYAIVRADLLGVPLPRFAVNRGAVAAGALALLFIVAQIAQNFFSAEYGLLTGSVVAGAFLFAANPIQRAIERASGVGGSRQAGLSDGETITATTRAAENERAYKIAFRKFHADGRITRDEELALAHLADELGLTTRRATELRHEIESDHGVR